MCVPPKKKEIKNQKKRKKKEGEVKGKGVCTPPKKKEIKKTKNKREREIEVSTPLKRPSRQVFVNPREEKKRKNKRINFFLLRTLLSGCQDRRACVCVYVSCTV